MKEKLEVRWSNDLVGWIIDPKIDMFHFYGRWIPASTEASRRILAAIATDTDVWVSVGDASELFGTVEALSDDEIEITMRTKK